MILTDLAQHNKKRLKQHDVMSIARSVKSGLSRLASIGYVRGALLEGERGVVVVTTPEGRRYEVAVREISCDEEIEQAGTYVTARHDLAVAHLADLPPVTAEPAHFDSALAAKAAELRGCPVKKTMITGKAARVLEAHAAALKDKIDGEYVYRNYAVNYDGRTWGDLMPSEQQAWEDKARQLLEGAIETSSPVAAKAPEPATGRDLYLTMIDNSGMHCNRFPGWDELDEATQADWNRKAQN